MKRSTLFLAGVLALVAVGCVIRTEHKIDAHVQLDVRYIAEQAEDVLDFIEGNTDELPALDGDPEESGAAAAWLRFAVQTLDPMPAAHAQALDTNSPLIRQILQQLRARHGDIQALKDKGCLGETNRGYVALRPCDTLNDDEKNEAQKLLAMENEDRKALYREIARLNADAGATVGKIEEIYAAQRRERAKSGEQFELPPAGPQFDQFEPTALCQRLGDDCAPGAWVTVP